MNKFARQKNSCSSNSPAESLLSATTDFSKRHFKKGSLNSENVTSMISCHFWAIPLTVNFPLLTLIMVLLILADIFRQPSIV